MICGNFHASPASNVNKLTRPGDRFLVAKFFAPRRWDLAVFRYPEDPASLYVMRVVGMPGEKLYIKDGSVWINDEKLMPPESLDGITYTSQSPQWYSVALWGTVDRPAVLGEDEYFVLGDFSAQSRDSRWWERGAIGHNPYAVPQSNLVGVVTHTFWPPRRLRVHR